MKYFLSLLIIGSVFLSACAPASPSAQHGQPSGGHQKRGAEAKNLVVRDRSTDTEIAFSVEEDDKNFTDYGISHTKEMHLIVVRNDLQHFQHLHPERDADGIWRVPFGTPVGGTYWIYADFIEKNESPHTIRFEHEFAGDSGVQGIGKNFDKTKMVDEYRIAFQPSISGQDVSFRYYITNAAGDRPHLEEYLGAIGHSVLISPSGDFIHTHPSGENEEPVFVTPLPRDSFYRAFTQFQINGKVLTVNFDWQP